jgi:hypothetical protein
MTSPEALLGSMPNRYPAQQEKVPRHRHAPGALPGGAIGGGGGRGLVVLWWLGLGAGGAESPREFFVILSARVVHAFITYIQSYRPNSFPPNVITVHKVVPVGIAWER